MKMNSRILGGVAAVALLQFATTGALALGGTLSSLDRTAGYYSGNGGEFTIKGSGLDLSGYTSDTSLTSDGFQTFCLETDEFTFSGSGDYYVNDRAVNGGANIPLVGFDRLSKGVAWLYSLFAKGELDDYGYDYAAGSGREGTAWELQRAIWMLEGEIGWDGDNDFLEDAALALTLDQAGLQANAATGEYGVYVLNITKDGEVAQDQLYYNPNGLLVPEGGLSLVLLGMSLSGLALLRRRYQAA